MNFESVRNHAFEAKSEKTKAITLLLAPCFPAPGRTAHVINQRLNIAQILEQSAQARERQHIWAVRRRPLRRVMNFHEHRIDSAGHPGTREWFDVLRQSPSCITQTTWKLKRMRHVKYNRHAELAHDRKRTHIDN